MGQSLVGKTLKIKKGSPYPLGATPDNKGVNFSVFSKHAFSIELLLFETNTSKNPFETIKLDREKHRTYHFWHAYVEGLKPGVFYAFRVDGPNDIKNGFRFNRNKLLVDPYAKGFDYTLWNRMDACHDGDNLETSIRSAIIDTKKYNWEGDKPLNLPLDNTIIYEMHVGNFTKSPTSNCKYKGKFKGVIEKIPYLKSLGITAVELMPVMDFDSGNPKNNWGYGTIGFFAPESSYCIKPDKASHVNDFRDLVKAFHKAGIEVILDVVFGYTTEGDHSGPVLSFKGFDNTIYYELSNQDREFYMNFSGCGNTFNTNHPVVAKFILDCLEYWVEEMHVDGFRFDEASILSRDEQGNLLNYPHVIWNIDLSEKLANTKLFAEPWDAGGAYLVGKFPSYRFVEWNGRFRDDIRRFVRGDLGLVQQVASRITGSADLYQNSGRLPLNSLNFITSHDGFTLYDLVSYNNKHNEANGEDNRDGIDENYSWNCGMEGETDNAFVNHLRMKQVKNFLSILFLSKGIPMIVMGDEIGRTQKGNNNAYCQDNEISWFDWSLIEENYSLLIFFKRIVLLRKQYKFLHDNDLFVDCNSEGWPDIQFHGCKINSPGWDETTRILSYTIKGRFHVIFNMEDKELTFELPAGKNWKVAVNTAENGVGAYMPGLEKPLLDKKSLTVESKSIVVLIAK